MLNLFETFNQSSQDFWRSQIIAKMKVPTVVMHDNGFLPEEVDSPIKYFCDLKNSNHLPLYFDRIKVPPYWRITANAENGHIFDLKKKRGDIIFFRNDNKRMVKEVHWLDDDEKIDWIEHYDQHGRLFAKTYCSQGAPRVRKYFDRNGHLVIIHYLTSGDVFLNFRRQKRHFANYSQFVVYYLQLRHYKLDRIFYNTLNEALGVSLSLPADSGEDVLFWDERYPQQNMPGNMQYLLQNDTRTKHIVFQNYREWMFHKDYLPKDGKVDFQYLGMIYPHPRGNALHPQALIITNSDDIPQLEKLAQLLPNLHINVCAVTNMSEKLLSMKRYENISLYPRVMQGQLMNLLKECDVYLDINKGNEILDAVRGAFEQNMLIVAFTDTLHDARFVAQQNIYRPGQVQAMSQKIVSGLVNPKQMGALVDEQRLEASDVWPKDYQRVLGAWIK